MVVLIFHVDINLTDGNNYEQFQLNFSFVFLTVVPWVV